MQIADIELGQDLEGFFVLSDAAVKIGSNGSPYLAGKLSDRSGTVDIKIWNYGSTADALPVGGVVKVRGKVTEFMGKPQINVGRIRPAQEGDSYDLADLVPCAPIDPEAEWAELRTLPDSMEDPDFRAVAEALLERHEDALRTIPAAKSIHHAFRNGLLMHTTSMLRAANFLADLYREVIRRDLLLCGTLAHDLAKEQEFLFSPLGLAADYSPEGQLLGHLYMGAREMDALCRELGVPEEKSLLLQHMILAHHGEAEFGSPIPPQCAEAELLSLVDRIDSRMEIYAETLSGLAPGTFSGKVFALDHKVYHPALEEVVPDV